MELKQYLRALWRWSWLIFLATVVAMASSYWFTGQMPRIYKASTTLMVGQFLQSPDPTTQDFFTSQQLAQSYVQLVRRQPVLQATIDTLGLRMDWRSLATQVNATPVAGTQLIQISVIDTDPQRARAIADEIAHQLILKSPTPAQQEQEQHRQFVNQQLADLQAKIKDAEEQLEELEKRLALEVSARGIQDIQNQMAVLQQKITTWQGNYAELLNFYAGSRTNYLSVVEPASVPTTPISPNVRTNMLLAGVVGLLLSVGAALLLEYLDDTLKTKEDVDQTLNLPTLGIIPHIRKLREPSDHLPTMQDPLSHIAEAYRTLRTNVQFSSLGNPSGHLLVTSSRPLEGKTTTACNLGITLAQAGRRVILVDTDLRRPAMHRFFEVPNREGLTSLLLDETLPVEAALVDTPVPNLRLLPCGPIPPNPADLLASDPMKRRLEEMKKLAEVLIFDSPPVLAVADAGVLGGLVGNVILVVKGERTRTDAVRRSKEILEQLGLKILGIVLNDLPPRYTDGYYYGGYRYYYASNGERRKRKRSKARNGRRSLIDRLLRRHRGRDGEDERKGG